MSDFLTALFSVLVLVLFVWLPGGTLMAAGHFLLSLPMQRRDRALFFLDLIETALDRGQSVEQTILSAAESRDRVMGVKFFMLAAHLEYGARLGEALEKVPTFLPPQVNAMLRAGEKLGDLKKVLPACREALRVAPDTVRSAVHYQVGILLVFAPIAVWLIWVQMTFIIPRFKDVFAGVGIKLWPVAEFVFNYARQLVLLQICIFFLLLAVTVGYIGGPSLLRWFKFSMFGISPGSVIDWITWQVPWKRKKLLRSFSAMLAVLLDGGVPEPEAVMLAGESTANEICRRRVRRVLDLLAGGAKLDEAVRAFDDNGEFHWRLTNAAHARGGFLAALRGWHEALDAKAFQQEETATHFLTSGIVILNGVVVGLIATAMFGMLIMMLRRMLEL